MVMGYQLKINQKCKLGTSMRNTSATGCESLQLWTRWVRLLRKIMLYEWSRPMLRKIECNCRGYRRREREERGELGPMRPWCTSYLLLSEELLLLGVGEEQERLEELANEHGDQRHVASFGLEQVEHQPLAVRTQLRCDAHS